MAQLIGYKRENFRGDSGAIITGYTLYVGLPLQDDDSAGMQVLRLYASDKKIGSNCDLANMVGKDVYVSYGWDTKRHKFRFYGIAENTSSEE